MIKIQQEHLKHCFDVLVGSFKGKKVVFSEKAEDFQCPLFVTWNHKGQLRGCIGTFEKQQISEGLGKYAKIAAFQDSRFNPISEKELKHLSLNISFLTNFEKGKDWMDWEFGKNGVEIEFEKNGYHSSTYLPEVAEHFSSKKEFMENLIEKAGFYGKAEEVVDLIKLTRYESVKGSMSYDEYLKLI